MCGFGRGRSATTVAQGLAGGNGANAQVIPGWRKGRTQILERVLIGIARGPCECALFYPSCDLSEVFSPHACGKSWIKREPFCFQVGPHRDRLGDLGARFNPVGLHLLRYRACHNFPINPKLLPPLYTRRAHPTSMPHKRELGCQARCPAPTSTSAWSYWVSSGRVAAHR